MPAVESLIQLAYDPTAWAALAALIVMEIVLGIDNLILVSILTNALPEQQRPVARRVGIGLAVILRLAFLAMIAVIVRLTDPVISIFEHSFSWRDIILIAGGLFLVWKATTEIHHRVDPLSKPDVSASRAAPPTFAAVIAQIIVLDLVFSLDSIITAVGMTRHLPIMVIAVVIAMSLMLFSVDFVANFMKANQTVVMLALAFLLMIGMALIADGFGVDVPKGYIYAAMAFSALVEGLNVLSRRARGRRHAEQLRSAPGVEQSVLEPHGRPRRWYS